MWLDAVMNENGLIRLDNLKRLGLSAAELSDRVGGLKSYWHGMLSGHRPFGEKIARKIEEQLELPRGAMDQDCAVTAVPARPYKPSGFANALAMMYDDLPDDDAIRAAVWVSVQHVFREASAPQSSPSADAPAPTRPAKQRHG